MTLIFVKTWSISKNKAFEIQLNKFDPKMIFEIDFLVRDSNMDHKGVSFDFGLFGFWIHFDFYDKRHSDVYDQAIYSSIGTLAKWEGIGTTPRY